MARWRRIPESEERITPKLIHSVEDIARPLRDARDLDPLMARIGDARLVLLGEASHGTAEFYTWRAEISKRLVAGKGFSFIAVEGDWPACYRVNRWVKSLPGADSGVREALDAFERWPTWMWAKRSHETAAPLRRVSVYR